MWGPIWTALKKLFGIAAGERVQVRADFDSVTNRLQGMLDSVLVRLGAVEKKLEDCEKKETEYRKQAFEMQTKIEELQSTVRRLEARTA